MIKFYNIICNKCRIIIRTTKISDLDSRNNTHFCNECKLINKVNKNKMKKKTNKSTGFKGITTLPSGNYRVRKTVNGQRFDKVVSSLRKAKEMYKLINY